MTGRQLIILVLFLILTWAGSAGIALATVELTGGGEQGPPGPPGEQGTQGPRGPAGSATTLDFAPGFTPVELRFALERLAQMFAVQTLLQEGLVTPGERLSSTHPQVEACVDYILDGEGSFVECGFERAP